MTKTWDTLVVGGGLAGLSAARELTHAGADVLVLEARARLGGRAWTGSFDGHPVELGGAYVHWLQPNVWNDIQRYGLAIEPTSDAERGAWFSDGRLHEGSIDELNAIIGAGTAWVCRDARDAIPMPFEPLATELARELDALSVKDRLDEIDDPVVRDVMDGTWSSLGSGPASEIGLVPTALHAFALSAWSVETLWETNGGYRLTDGTGALVDAIRADLGSAEVRQEAPVRSVSRAADEVRIETEDGSEHTARTCVVAVPVNALRGITFMPDLSAGRRRIVDAGILGRGLKVWATLRGEVPSFFAVAPSDQHISFLGSDTTIDGDTRVVGFGCSARDLDLHDREAVERAVRVLVPGAEVITAGGHDWTHDPFSLETWASMRPGQLSLADDLRRPEGEVFFAGGDLASGWAGYLDGAIESGIGTARDVLAHLAGEVMPSAGDM